MYWGWVVVASCHTDSHLPFPVGLHQTALSACLVALCFHEVLLDGWVVDQSVG